VGIKATEIPAVFRRLGQLAGGVESPSDFRQNPYDRTQAMMGLIRCESWRLIRRDEPTGAILGAGPRGAHANVNGFPCQHFHTHPEAHFGLNGDATSPTALMFHSALGGSNKFQEPAFVNGLV